MTDEIYLKNSLTANNSIITLGDTDDSGKGRHFKSRFIQPGLAGYPGQYGNALIKKENLDKFVYTLRNKPVIINHKDEIEEKDKVGEVFNVWFNPDDGWYWCDGIITDVTAQNLIQDKGWSVSCSYNFTSYNDDGGTENNVPYDIEFLDGEFMHLAIVDKPRYEGANIVMNAKDKDGEGEWITVKGTHIFIKDGQSKEDAVKEFIQRKRDLHSNTKKTSENFAKHIESAIDEVNQKGYISAKTAEAIGSQLHYVPETEKIQELFGNYEKYSKDGWGFNSKRMQSVLTKYEEDLKDHIRFDIERAYEPTNEMTIKKAAENISDILGHDVTEKDLSQTWEALPKHSNGMRDTGIFPELLKKNLGLEKDNYDRWLSLMGRNIHIKEGQSLADAIEERGEDKNKFKEYINLLDNNKIKNTKDSDGKDGEWITVKGNHIFVKEGQTKEEAVKEFINKQQNKPSDKKETNKQTEDWEFYYGDEKIGTSKIERDTKTGEGKTIEEKWEGKYSDKKDDNKESKSEESQYSEGRLKGEINSLEEEIEDMDDELRTLNDKLKRSERAIDKYSRDKARGYKEDIETLERKIKNKEAKLDKLYKEQESRKESSKDKSGDSEKKSIKDVSAKDFDDLNKEDIHYYAKSQKDDSITFLSYENQNKNIKRTELFDSNDVNVFAYSDNRGELKIIATPKNENVTTSDIKEAVLKGKAKLDKKYVSNSTKVKEITMSVLNELESFVKGVIRNANDEDEKEIKNEKVDKRELIEEVGGMLKGKVDDEIIKTIIKKMEEASYDESEAGSADNKKVKNESEEEKEDKKAENKKVKNEESEDDKEKAEELKKDEKEDVENKCNNSKTDFYDKMNKIYNSSLTPSKSETEYTSRADRLKAGEEYFKV